MESLYVERILKAKVYDVALESPLDWLPQLSRRFGRECLLKREDLQPLFNFKLRGAYNKIANLPESTRIKGVVASGPGNHASAVALAARRIGIAAHLVLPSNSMRETQEQIAALGGSLILEGSSPEEARDRAIQFALENEMTFVHPSDDPDVIAGNGTIAVEIFRQSQGHVGAIFVPVGGGGLIAGIAAYAKSIYPSTKIIGVQPTDACAFHESLKAGQRVTLQQVGGFAESVAVKSIGEEPFHLVKKFVDDILLVPNHKITEAVRAIYEDVRAILEPAGALGVAGLLSYLKDAKPLEGRLVAIGCGANASWEQFSFLTYKSQQLKSDTAMWDVFLSHASEDKESFARPLAEALRNRGLSVWFDELTLRVGDSLRRTIDRGLSRSHYGVVVLSPSFFKKEWPQRELDGLVARESSGTKLILPVWHNVGFEDVRRYSAPLSDRLATSSNRGVNAVVNDLLNAMGFEAEP